MVRWFCVRSDEPIVRRKAPAPPPPPESEFICGPDGRLTDCRKAKRGDLVGWCSTCGGEQFNFVRHRRPRRISKRQLRLAIAVSVYVKARRVLRTSTINTHAHKLAEKIEREAFDVLAAAHDEYNAGNQNGVEE